MLENGPRCLNVGWEVETRHLFHLMSQEELSKECYSALPMRVQPAGSQQLSAFCVAVLGGMLLHQQPFARTGSVAKLSCCPTPAWSLQCKAVWCWKLACQGVCGPRKSKWLCSMSVCPCCSVLAMWGQILKAKARAQHIECAGKDPPNQGHRARVRSAQRKNRLHGDLWVRTRDSVKKTVSQRLDNK